MSESKNEAQNPNSKKDETKTKVQKPKGPIRFEAVIPVVIIIALIYVYFHFFFDRHMKSAIEFGGYQALGSEVNVAEVKTSFWNASLSIKGIQVTNAENPTHNLFEIGEIRFSCTWDAILRAKILINEAVIENIGIANRRSRPGKVKPPEPPSNEPSALAKEADKLKDKALDKVEEEYDQNIFGDIASVAGGADANEQLKKIEGELKSKVKMKEVETLVQTKQKYWEDRFKTLPKESEVRNLGDRLKAVQTSNFKNPQELEKSLKEIDSVLKEADAKVKSVQSAAQDLETDVKLLELEVKNLDQAVKDDIKSLQERLSLPDFDAAKLVKALLMPYIQPYMNQFQHYNALAKKYLPPNIVNKKNKDEADVVQPRPRAKGVSYEFGRPNAYPLFWMKRAAINSKANAEKGFGDLSGELTHVTSNQPLIGKPTTFKLAGNFPTQEIMDMLLQVVLDATRPENKVIAQFAIGSYPIGNKVITKSDDVSLAFVKATGSMNLNAEINSEVGFKFQLLNEMKQVQYDIAAKSKDIEQILKNVFNGIPVFNLNVSGEGRFPKIPLKIVSNIGEELSRGFSREINAKIEEAKAKVKAYVDEQINQQKQKIEADLNKLKTQYQKEITKINEQINAQKKDAEQKVETAKKDADAQLKKEKKKAEEDLKKKALEEMKKKLGF